MAYTYSRPENFKKKSPPKNSSNDMNQFNGILFGQFPFSKSKIYCEKFFGLDFLKQAYYVIELCKKKE